MIKISILEVDESAIKKNCLRAKQICKGQKICAVIKANCYGLGADKIIKVIESEVDFFAVSSAAEFFAARKFTDKPILILCPVYENLPRLIECGARLTISNGESLAAVLAAAKLSKKICRVHICLNTGMNRFGIKDKSRFLRTVKLISGEKNIVIEGVFSHFHSAENELLTQAQLTSFGKMLEGFPLGFQTIFHIAASGAMHQNCYDMVRLGIAIFGDKNFCTVRLTSKILDFQDLSAGESAGYGAKFVASQKTRLAVVAIGYADGIFRSIAGKGYVLVHGARARIVAVCMDSLIVDITGISARVNDEVVLIGKSGDERITLGDMAGWCGTIDYEILTSISARVVRKYKCIEKNATNFTKKCR